MGLCHSLYRTYLVGLIPWQGLVKEKKPTTHEVFTCARDIFYLTTPKPAQVDNCAISIQIPLRYTGDLIVTNAALQ